MDHLDRCEMVEKQLNMEPLTKGRGTSAVSISVSLFSVVSFSCYVSIISVSNSLTANDAFVLINY